MNLSNTKNYQKYLALSSLMVMLFLTGCQPSIPPQETNPSTTPTPTTDQQTQTLPTSNYSATDRANYQAAMELKDASYCSKITDKAYQQSCKSQLSDSVTLQQALAKNDPTLCTKLSIKDNQDACKIAIEVNVKKSQQEKDAEAQIQVVQKLRDEIIATGDYTRCKEITDENFRSVCELQILSNKVLQTKDQTWCDKASTKDLQQKCRDISR